MRAARAAPAKGAAPAGSGPVRVRMHTLTIRGTSLAGTPDTGGTITKTITSAYRTGR
jgi:hypothetical protein